MEFIVLILVLYLVFGIMISRILVVILKPSAESREYSISSVIVLIYGSSYLIFFNALSYFQAKSTEAVDPMEKAYTPFAKEHFFTFIAFHAISILALIRIWRKGSNQAPLSLVFTLAALVCGVVLSVFTLIQLSIVEANLHTYDANNVVMMGAPLCHLLLCLYFLARAVYTESQLAVDRKFRNKLLHRLNSFLGRSKVLPLWVVVAVFPLYSAVTLVLLLFGQHANSLVRVFTDTSTWYFSQHTHPPFLDHQGHYLCTVAACGSPRVVKPLRLGTRHGHEIIVNRQLLVANAFEAILERRIPRTHRIIRRLYDRYGYPLSRRINTPFKSNLVYVLMKPLEWFFLCVIYFQERDPEALIHAQYPRKGEK
jgi:hypothetical protein